MSKVEFGGVNNNYGLYHHNEKPASKEEEAVKDVPVQNESKAANPERVMDALNLMGAHNKAQIQGKAIDPAKFLSAERISSVENSMAEFEAGVAKYAAAIKAEFGNLLSDDDVMALAANAFALQG